MNGEPEITIKTEPNINSGRLSSFRSPRDLTLGANKVVPKKVFVPNLNVIRNKTKSNSSSNDATNRERRRDAKDVAGARAPRTMGPDKFKSSIVKAGGVFSEGVAASARHSSSRSYGGSREPRDEPQALQKPTIKPKETLKIDKNMEVQQIKELTNDEEEMDLYSEVFGPTKLPINKNCLKQFKTPSEDNVKSIKLDVTIKTEPMDPENNETIWDPLSDIKPDVKIKMEPEPPSDAHTLFTTQTPTLILMQFPDSLPGRGPEEEDPSNSKSSKDSQNNADSAGDVKPKVNMCTAKHLEEGQIGKIQIYKSGKVKMLIGNTLYDLALGTQACFRQDVMSVNVNSELRSGSVINLGPIQSKITMTPNWESLFQQMETN